jgi:hypothetical protein
MNKDGTYPTWDVELTFKFKEKASTYQVAQLKGFMKLTKMIEDILIDTGHKIPIFDDEGKEVKTC